MAHYYSKSKKGFFCDEVEGLIIPPDAVEISEETWRNLMQGQAEGKTISSDEKGNPILLDRPAPTKDETIAYLSIAIQQSLDTSATTWGYDNIVSGCSYANSTNAQYAADATALIQWRDSVWEWANAKFETVAPGTMPDDFLPDMPPFPAKPVIN